LLYKNYTNDLTFYDLFEYAHYVTNTFSNCQIGKFTGPVIGLQLIITMCKYCWVCLRDMLTFHPWSRIDKKFILYRPHTTLWQPSILSIDCFSHVVVVPSSARHPVFLLLWCRCTSPFLSMLSHRHPISLGVFLCLFCLRFYPLKFPF